MRRPVVLWAVALVAACSTQNSETSSSSNAAPSTAKSEVPTPPAWLNVKIYASLYHAGRDVEIVGPIDATRTSSLFNGFTVPSFPDVTDDLRRYAAALRADGIVQPSCRRYKPNAELLGPAVTCTALAVRTGQAVSGSAKQRSGGGAGSGFFINARGDLVTNEHVVRQCKTVTVLAEGTETQGTVASVDPKNDLALVRTGRPPSAFVELRMAPPLRLAEPVMAVGYPMPGALAPVVHVTDGSVTALAGAKGSSSELQVSAPMQPGNSGGPLVDAAANLVGVNSTSVPFAGDGRPAQNVNFAVKTSTLATFLDAAGAEYRIATSRGELRKTDIATRAERFTAQVTCRSRAD